MKYLKLFEAYSDHEYHHEKLDDLLDGIQYILDEFNIVEYRLSIRNLMPLDTPPNWRFSYAKDNNHIKDHDGIVISLIDNFEKGQKILKKLESIAPRLERLIGCGIGIETSNIISSDELRKEYVRFSKKMGEEPGHPYIKIYLDPEENFSGIKYV